MYTESRLYLLWLQPEQQLFDECMYGRDYSKIIDFSIIAGITTSVEYTSYEYLRL